MAVIELGQAVQAALADQEQAAKPLPSRQRWQGLQTPMTSNSLTMPSLP